MIDIVAQDSFSGVLSNFGNIMTGLNSVVNLLQQAFDALVVPVVDFGKQASLTAARVEELALVDKILADNAGIAVDSIDPLAQSLRDEGIQADIAYETIAQMIRANLDLANATDLARIAQDSAVIAGQNSSDTLDQIIYGITTLNPLVLRHAGIIVDLQQGYMDYADTLGIASTDLTTAQKQQVAMNLVLAQGAVVAGSYETAMTNAYKQLGSFDRYINDIQLSIGNFLLPAFSDLIFATADWLKYVGKAVEDGGTLAPILTWIGDQAKIMVDNFASGVGFVTDFFESIITESNNVVNVLQPGGFGDAFVATFDPTKFLPTLLAKIDEFATNFMQSIADSINAWVDAGGATVLSEGIINWINQLGDILSSGALLNIGFVQAALNIARALVDALANVDWGGLAGSLDQFAAHILDAITNGIDALISSGAIDNINNFIVNFIENMGSGDEYDSPSLTAASRLVNALVRAFEDFDWTYLGIVIRKKITDSINSVDWGSLNDTFDAKMANAINGIDWEKSARAVGQAFAQLFSIDNLVPSLLLGLELAFEQLLSPLINLVNFLSTRTGQALSSGMRNAAWGIVEGLELGIVDNIANLLSFFADFSASVVNAVMDFFGISSPSTVFFQIGQNLILGLIGGIASMAGILLSAMTAILQTILGPLQPVLDLLGIDLNVGTITLPSFPTSTGGGTTTGSTGVSAQTVTNNYYGTVYFMGAGEPGSYYDCPYPNPLMNSSSGTLSAPGF